MRKPIYLDYAATTPVAPEVAAEMARCLGLDGVYANAASRTHRLGWEAEEAVENARLQVAELVGADSREIIWTSGATESDNLALKGVLDAADGPQHIIVSAVEHKAVLDTAAWLAWQGHEVTVLPVDPFGQVPVRSLANALRPDTRLVSIMHVNNETGTINDIAELGKLCQDNGTLFHVDAAQSAARLPINLRELAVDMASFSGHKMYGPKGVGALYVRRGVLSELQPQILGGGHEQGVRSGTLATHQCVGMGAAAELIRQNLSGDNAHIAGLRDRLWNGISDLPGIRLNGHPEERACSFLNVVFSGSQGEELLLALTDLAVATGSACTSARVEPSFVLKAMGLSDADAQASLRFSVGRYTTEEEIDYAISHIRQVVTRMQAMPA